ncbi:hypothetical protein [Verrucomicrobium sp. BvORR106]|uniref:hypothetical protein n=1 Tax=Verrucomicrobium sp. BvORR106 TaxID=1403819 RepID=UPI002240EE5B|nr:hypothetical protein [Verrucomicrobium sp. BvORR106]
MPEAEGIHTIDVCALQTAVSMAIAGPALFTGPLAVPIDTLLGIPILFCVLHAIAQEHEKLQAQKENNDGDKEGVSPEVAIGAGGPGVEPHVVPGHPGK